MYSVSAVTKLLCNNIDRAWVRGGGGEGGGGGNQPLARVSCNRHARESTNGILEQPSSALERDSLERVSGRMSDDETLCQKLESARGGRKGIEAKARERKRERWRDGEKQRAKS